MINMRNRRCRVCGQVPVASGGKRACNCPDKFYPWNRGERGSDEDLERLRQARYDWVPEPGYYAYEKAAPIIYLYEGGMWGCDSTTDLDIDLLEDFLQRQADARRGLPKLTGTFLEKVEQVIDMPDDGHPVPTA